MTMSNESGKQPVPHKKHVARLEREQQQTRIILYTFFGILGAVVLLLFYGWLDINVLQLNRPVAKVNDVEILVKEFEPRVKLRRQQLIDNYIQYQQYQQFFGMDATSQLQSIESQLSLPEFVGQSVLDEMINEEIVRQEAAKRGITASEEEINARIESEFGYFPDGTPTPTVTTTAFLPPTEPESLLEFLTPTLEATETPLSTATADSAPTATAQPVEGTPAEGTTLEPTATLEPIATATATLEPTATATTGPTPTALPTATPYTAEGFAERLGDTEVNLAKFGFDDTYLHNFFETLILREKLQAIVTADVQSVDEEIRARHILVADEATALDVIARLQAGEDFADLARELSTDTGSGANGGDLGWFGKNAMVPEFETAAYALENPGDITTVPVQSNFGFHIIQLLARREAPLTPDALQQAKDVAFQEWLTAAREGDYTVETFDVWQARVPTTPNFITAATESASLGQTQQAEQLSTLEAQDEGTETPAP
jgi:parvulin-like peptidyl-prolyl isomerase